jgi:hypothetical protein
MHRPLRARDDARVKGRVDEGAGACRRIKAREEIQIVGLPVAETKRDGYAAREVGRVVDDTRQPRERFALTFFHMQSPLPAHRETRRDWLSAPL